MAKKFVRGITDVKTITNQDFDTNNVNDLLSDGQYNYIHRKKGKSEEYHNLTDNIKTISSDNTDLLTVTNNNKTTNTATLHPKHDAQKEQVLESTRNTVTINHGANGTTEKTTVDTNPQKVLEHDNLLTDYGISKNTSGNTTKLGLEYTKVADDFELNNLVNGRVIGYKLLNAPNYPGWYLVESINDGIFTYQKAISLYDDNTSYVRSRVTSEWGAWREQVGDKSVIDGLLAQKEQVLESTRNTVTINHAANGTAEKTTVDTNPLKVLEHENLISSSQYVTIEHEENSNKSEIKTDNLVSKLNELDNKIPTSVGGRNLAQGTSKDWSTPFTAFSGEQNTAISLYKVITDGLVVGDTLKTRIVLKYTNIVPTSGKTATVSLQGSGNVSAWGAGVYNSSDEKTLSGSGEVIIEHEFKINANHLKNNYWNLRLRTDYIASGSLQWKLAKVERGMFFTDWSPAPEDIHLTTLNDYSEDLNNLTYTCTAKPIDNTPNLPTGVGGNGVLSVIRVGNVVSQTYHALDNNVYYRITNNSSSTFVWTPWVKVTTTEV